VHRLKVLPDLLGELHDSHLMEAEVAAAVREAAAERANRLLELTLAAGELDQGRLRSERRRAQEPALLALARRNRARRDQVFGELAARWQGERIEQLLAATGELAAALRGGEDRDVAAARESRDAGDTAARPAPAVRQ
jgi:hypothetical protein